MLSNGCLGLHIHGSRSSLSQEVMEVIQAYIEEASRVLSGYQPHSALAELICQEEGR